jgi:hypothetical protein
MPSGNRNSTVIAPQALLMMNSPVVLEASQRLANRLAKLPPEERVEQAYALLFGRPPQQEEISDALQWVQEFGRIEKSERAWALFCQSLFAANEFIYLR